MENNKTCPSCGAPNSTETRFCTNCGLQLINTQTIINEQNNPQQGSQNSTVSNIESIPQQSINNNVMPPTKINDSDSTGNNLGLLSLILYFGGSIITSFITSLLPEQFRSIFSIFIGLCPLAGIVIMIIGRVSYPNNKLLKIAMWLIIGSIILSIVAFILFVIWCYITCATMDTSGCG